MFAEQLEIWSPSAEWLFLRSSPTCRWCAPGFCFAHHYLWNTGVLFCQTMLTVMPTSWESLRGLGGQAESTWHRAGHRQSLMARGEVRLQLTNTHQSINPCASIHNMSLSSSTWEMLNSVLKQRRATFRSKRPIQTWFKTLIYCPQFYAIWGFSLFQG